MSENFAPYQDTAPDVERSLSPPPPPRLQRQKEKQAQTAIHQQEPEQEQQQHPHAYYSDHRAQSPNIPSYQNSEGVFYQDDYANPDTDVDGLEAQQQRYHEQQPQTETMWGPRNGMDLYGTSLCLRLDWEACLAYLALPPAGAVFLLIQERRSDYVRFHAWQSALLFSTLFFVHLLFSWSSVLSWMIFILDIGLILLLTFGAYRDAETLDRYQVPFFGPLASSIVDDETI